MTEGWTYEVRDRPGRSLGKYCLLRYCLSLVLALAVLPFTVLPFTGVSSP